METDGYYACLCLPFEWVTYFNKKKAFLVDTCLEMHLTLGTSYKTDLHIKQTFFSFPYDFIFDRTISVLVRIKVTGHLVMSIIQFMNLISVHFWTYLL